MNERLLERWIQRARQEVQRIAFPEAEEEKILAAARASQDQGVIKAVLVGKPEQIRAAAGQYGIDISDMELVDCTNEAAIAAAAERYVQVNPLLSRKGVCRRAADPLNYAFILEAVGEVDGAFAGISHTTGQVILAAQTYLGMQQGIDTVSSTGLAIIPGFQGSEGELLLIGDSAVCEDPTPGQLADIAISACQTARELLEWEPRCAMLSFSTCGSADGATAARVAEAVQIVNARRPDLMIDGEFQLDSALKPEVAAKKVPRESAVAGRANILIWPNLNAGNIAVKLIQTFGRADVPGPILQGFAKPCSDCSRGAPVSELATNILMLALRAQKAHA